MAETGNVPQVEIPPPARAEFHQHRGRRWPLILSYLVLALVFATLLVFGGRWIYHKVHKPTSGVYVKPEATNKLPPTQSGSKTKKSTAAGGNKSNSSSSTKTSPRASSNLPNNGPGNVAALFVTTVIVASGLHYIYQLRRAE